jgi:hypothetical protein
LGYFARRLAASWLICVWILRLRRSVAVDVAADLGMLAGAGSAGLFGRVGRSIIR